MARHSDLNIERTYTAQAETVPRVSRFFVPTRTCHSLSMAFTNYGESGEGRFWARIQGNP